MANVSVGREAPDFTLRDENNQEVTLSSLRGSPVVLVFYPLDFSPICANELCAIRDDYPAFETKGAKVFGISRDSAWTHKAFREKEGIKHSLLTDMKGAVASRGLASLLPGVLESTPCSGSLKEVAHVRAEQATGPALLRADRYRRTGHPRRVRRSKLR